jgi:hypothetical protein
MTNIDDYACWRAALAGQSVADFAKQPHCGFWRRGKSGDPVAVWRDETGALVAKIGARAAVMANAEFDEMTFGFCLPNPISHETYTAVLRGEPWPSTDAVVHEQTAPGAGDNSAGASEVETLRDQIAAAIEQAKKYGAVADDETAAKAQSLRARLIELRGEAEGKHQAEKAPHLKAGREVDAKWLPMAKEAEDAQKVIRKALDKHENDKLLAARKVADDERKRQEAADRAAHADAVRSGKPVEAPAPPPVAAPVAPPAPIRGGYGRAAGVRTIKVAIIRDQDAVYMALRENVEVVALLKKLADKVVAAGATLPGVEVQEQRKVA